MEFFNIKSKSKLNLYLEVGNRRDDGYHEIRTIMVKTDLGDDIAIEMERSDRLKINLNCSDKNIPVNNDNTIVRILTFLNRIRKLNYKINITLHKTVPTKAGLGGGSGDAAAVASWLNNHLKGYYTPEELSKAGRDVGADIPFFFHNGIVELKGIGDEVVREFECFSIDFVVAKIKNIDMETSEAYKNLKNHLTKSEEDIILLGNGIFNKDIRLMASALKNDFENLVYKQFKELLYLKNKMIECGALNACLAGSGSAIFGIAKNEEQALMIKERIESPDLEVFTCKSAM